MIARHLSLLEVRKRDFLSVDSYCKKLKKSMSSTTGVA